MPNMNTPYGEFIGLSPGEFQMGNDKSYHTTLGEIRHEHKHAMQVHRVEINVKLAFLQTPITCGAMAIFVDKYPGLIRDTEFKFKIFKDAKSEYVLGDDTKHPLPDDSPPVSTYSYWKNVANASLPATGLNWSEATLVCETIGREISKHVRLPTEAEWEFACRAGTSTVYYFGDDTSQVVNHAWCCVNSGLEPKSVMSFNPNPWGLYDIAGNVWEWCQDKYSTTFYSRSPISDPICNDCEGVENERRVIRGGSSMNKTETCRSSHRFGLRPESRDRFLGLRPVIEIL
jgi:formylglycine-generating enzyme required for sulfatase activity